MLKNLSLALTDNRNEDFQHSGCPFWILAISQSLLDWQEDVQSQQSRNGQQRGVGRAHHARSNGTKSKVGNDWVADVFESDRDN